MSTSPPSMPSAGKPARLISVYHGVLYGNFSASSKGALRIRENSLPLPILDQTLLARPSSSLQTTAARPTRFQTRAQLRVARGRSLNKDEFSFAPVAEIITGNLPATATLMFHVKHDVRQTHIPIEVRDRNPTYLGPGCRIQIHWR